MGGGGWGGTDEIEGCETERKKNSRDFRLLYAASEFLSLVGEAIDCSAKKDIDMRT